MFTRNELLIKLNRNEKVDGLSFVVHVDRIPENPEMSSNGGDYENGRTIAMWNGYILAARFWTSWDGGCCRGCGRYGGLYSSSEKDQCCESMLYKDAVESGEIIRVVTEGEEYNRLIKDLAREICWVPVQHQTNLEALDKQLVLF